MTIAVAMIVTFLATSFLSGRQTSTVVVNPVVISAGDDSSNAGNDLTDMFLASLMRTNVFNVIDARTGQQPDADFYLSSSVNYREEEVEVGVEEKERKYRSRSTKESAETVKTFRQQVSFLRIDISVADGSGKVHFTEVGELDETSTGTVGSAARPGGRLLGRPAGDVRRHRRTAVHSQICGRQRRSDHGSHDRGCRQGEQGLGWQPATKWTFGEATSSPMLPAKSYFRAWRASARRK